MAEYKLVLPSMGEGVMEATLNNWLKNIGDIINEDDSVIEISTDKVDSDVPSPISGKLIKQLKGINEIVKIGETFAILETDDDISQIDETTNFENVSFIDSFNLPIIEDINSENILHDNESNLISIEEPKYLSPLVKSIISEEKITDQELKTIKGTGAENRITKNDIFDFLKNRHLFVSKEISTKFDNSDKNNSTNIDHNFSSLISTDKNNLVLKNSENNEIIEMDKTRKLIAKHMVDSKKISPHATAFMETDVTNIVKWRTKAKDIFEKREHTKLTFMPIFVYLLVKTIKDFPMVNISVEGDFIIKKKNINIGMATAMPNGNLIVPVIKNADQLSIAGLAKNINDLASRARNNQLKPNEIQGGTYTLTNIGSFGNLMGTPIINQPQAAIMAVGAIVKKPAVIETSDGDLIGIRQKMFCSHAFDHRVIDGALGGMFLQKFCDYLQNFDLNTEI